MFQWVLSSKGLAQSAEQSSEADSATPLENTESKKDGTDPVNKPGAQNNKMMPGWARFVPFFVSAVFFLSRFFALFAPLPLLMLYMQKGRRWTWLAAISNGVIVGLAGGLSGLLFYCVFVISLSLTLPELLVRKKSMAGSAALTLLVMTFAAAIVALGYSSFQHVNLMDELSQTIGQTVDYFTKTLASSSSTWMDPSEIAELKRSLVLEFPSALAIFALILVWSNLVILIKANPNGLRERLGLDLAYLKKWKAPEFLVWPTILSGFFLIGDFGIVSVVALNVFKFLMAVYVIQGLSVLSYFYDLWGIRGLFRFMGLALPLLLSSPLIAGVGFFDLWFDFRSKFRQS